MTKDERKALLSEVAEKKVKAISSNALIVCKAPIAMIDDGYSMCVIYEDKQRLYLCECYMVKDEARCNLRLFKEF